MRKVFIDCGFNQGRATKSFSNREEYEDKFEYFAFDPMADTIFHKKKVEECFPYVTFYKKAVWIENGTTTFYKNARRKFQASGLFKNGSGHNEPVEAETVDFSKWIIDNFSEDDKIIVKIDIEGAEYEVIPKMIEDGSIYMIHTIYIETHKRKKGIKGTGKELLSQLRGLENGPIVKHQIEMKKYRVDPSKG